MHTFNTGNCTKYENDENICRTQNTCTWSHVNHNNFGGKNHRSTKQTRFLYRLQNDAKHKWHAQDDGGNKRKKDMTDA